jgi:hypothetical protein
VLPALLATAVVSKTFINYGIGKGLFCLKRLLPKLVKAFALSRILPGMDKRLRMLRVHVLLLFNFQETNS